MKKIALEEAVIVPGQVDLVRADTNPALRHHVDRLLDITSERLREMDANETAVAVLSLSSPGTQAVLDASAAPRLAREWDDRLAEAVSLHTDRFKVFAALPMRDPEIAAAELTRTVRGARLRRVP